MAEYVISQEKLLEDLDIRIGDGDHGRNMKSGFSQVLEELPRMHYTCAEDVFLAVGTVLMDVSGGASGVLFGTMFVSGVIKRGKSFSLTLEDIAQIFRVSLNALLSRSRSRSGDKTLIDALEPAVLALEKSVAAEADIPEGFAASAAAALQGAEKTRELQAVRGRARYYEGKGLGIQDPGATTVSLIFEAMSQWASKKNWADKNIDAQVITLTLNPCQDRTIDIDRQIYGGTNKILEVRNDVSGKGINVSCVLRRFGVSTRCLGFNYSEGAKIVERFLNEMDIPFDFVSVPGMLRTNIKIFEKATGVMTEYNESGLSVPKEAVGGLLDKISLAAGHAKILTLCGSLPHGVPVNIYRIIIERANLEGCRTILDTSGQALCEGIKAIPYMIKPNIQELTNTFAKEIEEGMSLDGVVQMLLNTGIHYICLSLGNKGACLASRERILYARELDVEVKGIQGAGDSMVAGMCSAILQDRTDEEILAFGIAAAAGSLTHSGTQLCRKEDFDELLPLVQVREISSIESLGTVLADSPPGVIGDGSR